MRRYVIGPPQCATIHSHGASWRRQIHNSRVKLGAGLSFRETGNIEKLCSSNLSIQIKNRHNSLAGELHHRRRSAPPASQMTSSLTPSPSGVMNRRNGNWLAPSISQLTAMAATFRATLSGYRSTSKLWARTPRPVGRLNTSGDCDRSWPWQSRHRNLRPPVLISTNFMGFSHLGQSGGGVFFRIRFPLLSSDGVNA